MGRLGTLAALAVVILMIGGAWGDVYMHNPRGSNNRLNEESTNRANNNRMCDTQVQIDPPPKKHQIPRFDLRPIRSIYLFWGGGATIRLE
jgi:hypothetical protein